MKPTSFSGIWPAMLTPLTSDLSIDQPRFSAHALALLRAGCGGVTPFGTTGEGPSFSVGERMAAVDALVTAGVPADRIIVSTSCAAITDVVTLTKHAVEVGAHGCLMLPPFYFKGVSDAGVLDAYRYVIDRISARSGHTRPRLYLYHLPQVSAAPLTHEVIATLQREYPGVIAGIKDSECNRANSVALAERFGRDLSVYVGNELDLRTLGRMGSKGAISGLANFWPKLVAQLVGQPDAPGTGALHARVQALLDGVSRHALIPALKVVMAWQSGDDAWLRVRAPLKATTRDEAELLRRSLAAAGVRPEDA
jgi:4-hydroxy-tetrahydrodipicolinate synthase